MSENAKANTPAPAPSPDDGGVINRAGTYLLGRSWKTTLAGGVVMGGSFALIVLKYLHHELTVEGAIPLVMGLVGGGGLGLAKDHNVTGSA